MVKISPPARAPHGHRVHLHLLVAHHPVGVLHAEVALVEDEEEGLEHKVVDYKKLNPTLR